MSVDATESGDVLFVPAAMTLRLPGGLLWVEGGYRYDTSDPYAMTISFGEALPGTGPLPEWTFARELASQGRHRPIGEGDVYIEPRRWRRQVWMDLGATASMQARVSRRTLDAFLDASHSMVPPGQESDFQEQALNRAAAQLEWVVA